MKCRMVPFIATFICLVFAAAADVKVGQPAPEISIAAVSAVTASTVFGVIDAGAQTQTPAPSTFEVASVRSSTGNSGQTTAERARGWGDVTGRVNLEDIHLTDVLLRAWGRSGSLWPTCGFPKQKKGREPL
jgi:hypothetical protein